MALQCITNCKYASSTNILRTREREFFRCGRPNFLEQQTSDFSKFNGVSTRTRGSWVSAVILRKSGSIFHNVVQTSFAASQEFSMRVTAGVGGGCCKGGGGGQSPQRWAFLQCLFRPKYSV